MEQLYKLTEVAKLLSVTRKTVYNWIDDGILNYVLINGHRRIAESELKKFVKKGE